MKIVYYTFYNSRVDIDYKLNAKYFDSIFVFYCNAKPKNIVGNVKFINTKIDIEIESEDDFVISRIVKFEPWKFLGQFEKYVYFDFRIQLSKKFIDYVAQQKSPCFLNHREGGVLKDEILRIIQRDRVECAKLVKFLDVFENNLDSIITENGVMILDKSLKESIKKMSFWYNRINRDQILSSVFLKNELIYKFDFTLSDLSYFNVRPKKLNLINYLKLAVRGFLFSFVWNR